MSLPWYRRVGYGVAEVGVSGSEVMLRVSLLIYYTQVVGLEPDLASYAIAIAVLWDAVTDPLMGRLSDGANINNQKRRPFLMPAAIGLAGSLIVIFNVPHLETQPAKFLYLLLSYISANTFLTILSVPHTALAGDVSRDPKERMELFGWRMFFANVGLILGTAIPAVVVVFVGQGHKPEGVSSWIVGGLTLFGVFVTLLATSGLDMASAPSGRKSRLLADYKKDLKSVVSNHSFLWLSAAYMTATIGLTLNSSLALYYYQFFLRLEEVAIRGILAFFMVIFCLALPLWIWATRYLSKRIILIFNVTGLGIMTIFGYPFFPVGSVFFPLMAGLLGGIFVASVVLMDVSVANLAENQARKDGEDRASLGLYFGLWKMSSKLSRATALVITGHALSWIGFQAGSEPNQETAFYLALLFGPGVGIFLLASVLMIQWGHVRGANYE